MVMTERITRNSSAPILSLSDVFIDVPEISSIEMIDDEWKLKTIG